MILSDLFRLIVSHYPSVSMTQLRPAVCWSLKNAMYFQADDSHFYFFSPEFSRAWYPLGNLVGISNIVLAIWLKYSYLFLSPNLLPPSYPQTLCPHWPFPLAMNGSTHAKNSKIPLWILFLSSPIQSIHTFPCPSEFILSQSTASSSLPPLYCKALSLTWVAAVASWLGLFFSCSSEVCSS